MQKNLSHVVPSHPLNLRFHKCKIKEVVDLSGKLTKHEPQLLAKGTGYIPKSTKTAKKSLLEDGTDWGWPINKDNIDICLTRCCNKDFNTMLLLKKRNDIVIKKTDKGNAFVLRSISSGIGSMALKWSQNDVRPSKSGLKSKLAILAFKTKIAKNDF